MSEEHAGSVVCVISAQIVTGDPGDDAAQTALEWLPITTNWPNAKWIADGLNNGSLQAVPTWQDDRILSISICRVNT
jgi:hypothetical protein